MLRSYLKIAWRNLANNKTFTFLNIAGLAIGMTVALVIGLWIRYQYSFDRFLPGYGQAYQVRYNAVSNGDVLTQSQVCIPLAEALKKDVPEISYTALAFGPNGYGAAGSDYLEVDGKRLYASQVVAGRDVLRIFGYPLVEGNLDALNDPRSVVLTESTAKALFGNADPIGKIVGATGVGTAKVTAILKDIPNNASLRFDFITSFEFFQRHGWASLSQTNWSHALFKLYVALKPNVVYEQVAPKISGIVKKYSPDTYNTFKQQVIMQPLSDWHLYADYKNGKAVGGLIDYVHMFSIIGILVLFIACINFMNLSTARSGKRAREVGIRKVVGSTRQSLIIQFLLESLILTGLAFLLCLMLMHLVLPGFNTMARTDISIPYSNGWFLPMMLSYVMITGLLAGSRPAFYLSSFRPVKVLKGKINPGWSATRSRKILVVVQFTCSIALIVSTVIIYQQIQHARQRPRGYDPSRLIIGEGADVRFRVFRHEAESMGLVSSMTSCVSGPTETYSHNTIDNWPGRLPNEPLTVAMNAVGDSDYFRTLGIDFVEGRNFTGNDSVDNTSVILNEAAVKRMRLQHPLGQTISWTDPNAPHNLRIVGVVHDVLTNAPFASTEPGIYIYQPGWTFTVMYRLAPQVNTQVALTKLGELFHKYNPGVDFRYHFADENFQYLFEMENLVSRLAGIFAALAILISCLGLFGLAAYTAEQRTKEIGIRKVLGASTAQVMVLLTSDFVILVLLSCLIATPVAFYFLEHWLEGYYYRIHIGPGVFVLSAVAAIFITVITVGFQSLKAAWMNPVDSLRTE